MLARLKKERALSERDVGEDRKVDLRALFRRGRSLLSSTSTLEGRDEKSDEGRNKSNHSTGSQSKASILQSDLSPKKRSSFGDSHELDDFIKTQKPDSPKDVKDFDGIESSRSIDGLREIAKSLSLEMPRAYTSKEKEELDQMGRRITLGDSVGASVSDRKVLKRASTNSQTFGPDDVGNAVASVNNGDLVRMETFNGSPTALIRKTFHSKNEPSRLMSETAAESRNAEMTPEPNRRQSFSSRMSPLRKKSPKKIQKQEVQEFQIPSLAPCQGFLTPSDNLAMRSSEQEPFPHQVDIPDSSEVLMHCRLCNVMDQYHSIDQNFDFGTLKGVSRKALESFLQGDELDGLVRHHGPVVQGLVESANDLVLEGYFHEASKETCDKVEVAIFNNQELRQFIVIYRGSNGQQVKPIRSKHTRMEPTNLHPEQSVGVLPVFRDVYFSSKLESKVFDLLDSLAGKYPFCDVIMAGHSFGGALATIAALRFAISREMIRVSCHAFGSPKVGSSTFRQLVNSLPNLKVMRVEHATDRLAHAPEACTWTHVGHTINIDPSRKPCTVAYRFEKHKPVPKHVLASRKSEKPLGITVYVRDMEQCARRGRMWVKSYLGENVGNGVRGHKNEEREVV